MGKGMTRGFTDEQAECERMASEGAAALELVAGIIDRGRKYIIECRPMYLQGARNKGIVLQ